MRRFVTLFVALFAGIVISAGLAGAATAKVDEGAAASKGKPGKKHEKGKKGNKKRNVKPKVAILTRNATGLARGNFKVKVISSAQSKVRLISTSTTFDEPGAQLTRGKTVT